LWEAMPLIGGVREKIKSRRQKNFRLKRSGKIRGREKKEKVKEEILNR